MENDELSAFRSNSDLNSNSSKETIKPFFPNLDSLRFIAFLFVFVAHIWHVKLDGMIEPAWMNSLKQFAQIGVLGVNFFFVLSGFLITYLLLFEEKKRGHFIVWKFYLRRMLRIWPLYFLIVIASFLIIPSFMNSIGIDYQETANPWYYIFFINNFFILYHAYPYSPLLAVLWSIAIEEQFYLIWPWLLKYYRQYQNFLFISLIGMSVVFRWINAGDPPILYFHTLSMISDFGIGGLIANWSINKVVFFRKLKKIPRHSIVLIYLMIIVIFMLYFEIFDNLLSISLERMLWGGIFAFVIFEQTYCENRFFDFSKIPGFSWLGRISYGLYCFHPLGIIIAKDFLVSIDLLFFPLGHFIIFPIIAFTITVAISTLSYYLVEIKFLDWKKNF